MPTVIEFEENLSSLVEKPFDPKTFYSDFLQAVGAPPALLQQMESQGTLFGDAPLLWRKKLHFLLAPKGGVQRCVSYLELHPDTKKHKPGILLSTDGEDVIARDLITDEMMTCEYGRLSANFAFFLPLADIPRSTLPENSRIDVRATGRVAKFYDEIVRDNPEWRKEDKRHALNHFITQIIFCLFAEDTGIFPTEGMFTQTITTYCENDSKAASEVIKNLFTAMATPEAERKALPSYAAKFPHVNGGLFKGSQEVPNFTKGSVRYLLDAGALKWQYINPDIFGSMIQGIVNEKLRADLGMHYTSVPNILKVLEPLFLESLREQVSDAWGEAKELHKVLARLTKIRVFDPACGSGNFLVIAYRELREIEISVISRLHELESYRAPASSHVKLENFFGLEYIDFAAETARLALWIAEYQMTTRYAAEFGQRPPALPLKDAGIIVHGNALRINWDRVCPHPKDESIETYIAGNPPYLGRQKQTAEQKEDKKLVFNKRVKNYKSLDYVCCWLLKGADYIKKSSGRCLVSLVTTNSICQGQHVSILWPAIFKEGSEIDYAYLPFKWSNNATDNAGVTVIIVCIGKKSESEKTLFTENERIICENINPYLLPKENIIVEPRSNAAGSISGLPRMSFGNMPLCGSGLLMTREERDNLLSVCPEASPLIRPIVGSDEIIKNLERFCLWIDTKELEELAYSLPSVVERIEKVRGERLDSDDDVTKEYASTPHRFREMYSSRDTTIVVPSASSEHRHYLPVDIKPSEFIVSNLAFAIYDGPLWCLSLIASRLHLLWISTVCGQLESRIRYSNTLGWNTFPIRKLTEDEIKVLTKASEAIVVARNFYFEKSIAQVYEPIGMAEKYPVLHKAHLENDEIVERIYRQEAFKNDVERLDYLFSMYAQMRKAQK
ncbi:MAG: N-6 DNA methylase [Rhodobacteraceae bacterium]|nr:N-6 DNA methylase [Paracoccaceae bacterium]MCZ8083048.1 N-6 DNA methylase [Paracoccaceae bacterium]